MKRERSLWVAVGLAAGLAISTLWPHEPLHAVSNDRSSKFAIFTTEVAALTPMEGVFVLDFLTGRLTGAVLNNTSGKFTTAYFRNVAADFGVKPRAKPDYAVVSGRVQLPARGGITPATGAVYIAEMTSGKVAAYTFPFINSQAPVPPVQMGILDFFSFRQQAQE
ncbi:MAG: hypothetical protein O3A00_09400 [Planctomycetota bacterium]|nr:hypothetical protein [Planctomycetota bacterium]